LPQDPSLHRELEDPSGLNAGHVLGRGFRRPSGKQFSTLTVSGQRTTQNQLGSSSQDSAKSINGVSSVTVATMKTAGTQTICSGVAGDIACAAIGQMQVTATTI
jgi:hypothetical protein